MRSVHLAVVALLLSFAGCSDVEVDPGETVDDLPEVDGPTIEFDPSGKIIPFPNNLLLDPATGKVNLPEQCGESPTQAGLRTQVLNQLDGFGTFKSAMRVTLTEPVNAATLTGRVKLMQRVSNRVNAIPGESAVEVPVVAFPNTTERFTLDCSSSTTVDTITIVPMVPLQQKSTYVVALMAGIETADGAPYLASSTWSLVRQGTNPVTMVDGVIVAERTPLSATDEEDIPSLLGINQLWMAHASAMAFLDAALSAELANGRRDILLAWEFNTQTVTDPLDPDVAGSLAAMAPAAPLAGVFSIPTAASVSVLNYMRGALDASTATANDGTALCNAVECDQVGNVFGGTLTAPQYQSEVTNPVAKGAAIPGAFANPLAPAPVRDEVIQFLAFIPDDAPPANGYPTIVFAHGITRSKSDLHAIASQLAKVGFASIAIDYVAHGQRAIINSDDPLLGCDSTPTIENEPQCFAPFFSADLPGTRDNFRQSALDMDALIEAIQACTGTTCGAFEVDATQIGYLGQSIGSFLGSLVVSLNGDVKASVLNVGGLGLLDIIENTASDAFRCTLVDDLIDAGVLEGDKWDPTGMTGLCLTDGWKTQPNYPTFANAARWVLDPADGANFGGWLGGRTFLSQQVIDDETVPAITTEQLGALTGLTPAAADVATGPPAPSAAITTDVTDSKWVTYTTVTTPAPNSYSHGSLLAPVADAGGQLGTGQMQADAIYYLLANIVLN